MNPRRSSAMANAWMDMSLTAKESLRLLMVVAHPYNYAPFVELAGRCLHDPATAGL